MADYSLQAILESQVIDKLIPVIFAGDKRVEEMITKAGTNVGQADTWDGLPTLDKNGKAVTESDVARLAVTDGEHPAGMYARKPDNSGWEDQPYINFDSIDVSKILDAAKATDAEFSSAVDNKLATPAQVIAALAANVVASDAAYHPKGGDESLAVVGKNAQENTQEFVTANQLNATFTQEEVQAKYDAL